MQLSFDNLKRAVCTNNASHEVQRKSAFCFLVFCSANYEGWIFTALYCVQ